MLNICYEHNVFNYLSLLFDYADTKPGLFLSRALSRANEQCQQWLISRAKITVCMNILEEQLGTNCLVF